MGSRRGRAPPTERHQVVEIEVRASLGPLHQMVHVKPAPDSAGLTAPARAGQNRGLDGLPLLDRGGGRPVVRGPARRRRGDLQVGLRGVWGVSNRVDYEAPREARRYRPHVRRQASWQVTRGRPAKPWYTAQPYPGARSTVVEDVANGRAARPVMVALAGSPCGLLGIAHHGVREAKYAAIDNMSSTVRLVTVAFMSCAAMPARAPLFRS